MRLFIDTETVPSQHPDALTEAAAGVRPPASLKNAESIASWWATEAAAAAQEAWRKQSLDGGTAGEIVSIAVVDGEGREWAHCRAVGESEAALLVAFVWIESHVAAPLVPLGLLRQRNLSVSSIIGVLWAAAMFAWFFISALYMQQVLAWSPMQVGMAFLPANLVMAFCSLGLSAWVVMRWGIRGTLAGGLLLGALGLVLFALAPVQGEFMLHVLPGMLLLGVGSGIALNPLLLAAMGDVAPGDSGLASGVVNTAFMMGGALGLAILASAAGARTGALQAAGTALPVALHAGYQLAFGLAAVAALVATALGLVLRPTAMPAEGAAAAH